MWRWIYRSLLSEPLAFVMGVAATASALLLVMFYEAVWAGEAEQIVAYPRNAGADVWVMQRGVANMHMATSYLSDWKVEQVRRLSGVADVEPILYMNTVVEIGDEHWFAYVVGVDTPAEKAGPWKMADGRRQPGPDEVVVPAVFAEVTGLGLGSKLRIVDKHFRIVGLSEGTFSMANSVVFVTRTDLEDIMSALDIVSFLLVTAEAGVSAEELAERIEGEVDKVTALPAETFLSNDRQMALQMGVETVALMTFICGVLAVLLIAFTVYSQVARQRREFAVAKALGATDLRLYLTVGAQAGMLALASVILASGLAVILMPAVSKSVPMVTLKLTADSLLRISLSGVVVAVLASFIPARRLARLDPVTAFQS